ncbi:MAG TPA: hypothetical protein VHQ21_14490 [Rhodanobacteraceae bacterium]|jgi:hypothetical protein|nr:hypothetical protein [Rhodanobacteraceae bacterium]
MPPFVYLIRDVCLLRRGPQDLPYSVALLAAVAAAWLVLQLGVAVARSAPLDGVFAGATLELMFTLGALNVILTLRGLRNRFVQTATALLGCTLVFILLNVPILLLIGDPPTTVQQLSPLQILLVLVSLPLLVWKVLVDAHIFRHSFDVPYLSGVVIALLWIIAGMMLVGGAVGGS